MAMVPMRAFVILPFLFLVDSLVGSAHCLVFFKQISLESSPLDILPFNSRMINLKFGGPYNAKFSSTNQNEVFFSKPRCKKLKLFSISGYISKCMVWKEVEIPFQCRNKKEKKLFLGFKFSSCSFHFGLIHCYSQFPQFLERRRRNKI